MILALSVQAGADHEQQNNVGPHDRGSGVRGGLLWARDSARPAPSPPEAGRERVKTADLGGEDRFLAHVSTDKPIYRPGEMVYVRSVVLHAMTRVPLEMGPPKGRRRAPWLNQAFIEIKDPKGAVVVRASAETRDSVSGFGWQVPADQAGGEYTARVTYPSLGIPPAERKFDVRVYRAPRLRTQIKFLRDGFGPGDQVNATVDVKRAEGDVPSGATVTVIARVDGELVHRGTTRVGADGMAAARFELPDRIDRGQGTLAFVIEDGGVVETAAKTIPILLQTVDLQLYPEGGDLVVGLENRVYFEARTPYAKPADIAGQIVQTNVAGEPATVGRFRSQHEGRGRFAFTPEAGGQYAVRITEPAGIDSIFALPAVKDSGAVIRSPVVVYEPGQHVAVEVGVQPFQDVTVTLAQREKILAEARPNFRGAEFLPFATTTFDLNDNEGAGADGVLIATVWDADGKPLAERLIYRRPSRQIRLNIDTDSARYTPGGQVEMTVTATDEQGQPVEAVVGLTVTDDSVLEMIDKREQAPRLPVMVLLEPHVKELADAHLYLDRDDPDAPRAVDLLLGTQGWRRFATVDAARFLREHGDDARRVLAMRVVTRHERKAVRLLGGRVDRLQDFNFVEFEGAEVNGAVRFGLAVPRAPAAAQPGLAGELPGVDALRAPMPRRNAEQADKKLRAQLEMAQVKVLADAMFDVEDVAASRAAFESLTIRQYAHKARPMRQPGERLDFTETLYWHAGARTDDKTGRATVTFDLSDAVTTFRVFADAFDGRGALGEATAQVESVEPFYVEPKLPLEVTAGDQVVLPISVVNASSESIDQARIEIQAVFGASVPLIKPFELRPDARIRRLAAFTIGDLPGEGDFTIAATAGPFVDRVTRSLKIVPRGFPIQIGEGGMLKPNESLSFDVEIPPSRVPNSLQALVEVFPTPLANLDAALERLIREPSGCFEQTSSTTYPLVMAQQYFMSHTGVDPQLVVRAAEKLDRGYKRLTSFECTKRGYEWFGQDPGHEALTAFGLLEFHDMSKVREVDAAMLERTRSWIAGMKDGKGGFTRARRALHTWVADADCSNSYIVWALCQTGTDMNAYERELDQVKQAALRSTNSYVMALAADAADTTGDTATARTLMRNLADRQHEDGHVEGGTETIVGSRGQALAIETTSLAVCAWLSDDLFAGNIEHAIRWLAEACESGRFGSTQSTVLALRAINAYDAARAKPKAPGALQLLVDDKPVGEAVKFDQASHGKITLPDFAHLLAPGRHTVKVHMADGSAMPMMLSLSFHALKPASSNQCRVELNVSLSEDTPTEGDVLEANVVVSNTHDEPIPTPVAIIGVPAGLEVRHDQLKELVKAGAVAAYEVRGRDVVLYWRSLAEHQVVRFPISLVAAIPGTYTGPASRAYEYYADEFKAWVDGLGVTIEPVR